MINESKLILTEYKGYDTVFLFENNQIKELFLSKEKSLNLNDIFIGRVSKVKNDIQACFVDIGKDLKGFLPFENILPRALINRTYNGTLHEGDTVLVQVIKEPVKTKDATLSMHINYPSENMLLTLDDKKIHFSSKIETPIKENLLGSFEENITEFGVVVRTSAKYEKPEALISELNEASLDFSSMLKKASFLSVYSKIYVSKKPYIEFIKRINPKDYFEIITDKEEYFNELQSFENIRLYKDKELPLKALYGFDKAFLLATSKKVDLRCGGYLIIEPTEALTVIDVNTGKFVNHLSKEEAIKKVNFEAAEEIFRQIRLRNLSGIIIVDFINMKKKENNEELLNLLKGLLKNDTVKSKVVDMTKLALVEITREKKYSSIYDLLSQNSI